MAVLVYNMDVIVKSLRAIAASCACVDGFTHKHNIPTRTITTAHSANATSEVRLWGARLPRAASNQPLRIMLPESISAESVWFKVKVPRPNS